MNVVQGESRAMKNQPKHANELIRKDASLGIRGSILQIKSFNTTTTRVPIKTPRYQFSNNCTATKKSSMGPPVASPRSLKRKIIQSSSTRPDSSSSGHRRRILASDSAADTSQDITTPKNRPTALRYVSSSSRGGYSGTRSARSTSTSFVEPSVILAISEGRGMARGEIGMAAVDLKQPHLVLCQFSDTLLYTHTLTKINYFNPIEIIVPHTFCEGATASQLWQLIKEQCPAAHVTAVQRRHFNDSVARQQIQSLCTPQYSAVYLQVLHKFYALTAAAAVLKYVEYIQCVVFARESLKIEYHCSENTMIIDVGTATQLELVQPLVPSAGLTCCLLGVLGPTYTVGGIRALRASLLQPACNKQHIEARQDAVQEFIESDGLMVDIQNVLKKLSEVDKILFLCIETPITSMDKFGEAQITQTLLLKNTMELVPSLVEALNAAESNKLRNIKMDLENPHYNQIAERIRGTIHDGAHVERGAMGSIQRCFAVKPEINGLLDVARRMYSELIEDIQKIVENLAETYDLPLRLSQNVMKGFHIVMPVAPKNRSNFSVEELPPIFIQVVFNGANVTMSTEDLVLLDHQAKEALNEIQKMTNIVISTLLKELRPFMSSLYKLCEVVAELDILLALAQASSIGAYVRPEFSSYLEVRNGVHPLLDYNCAVMPVPNDIVATPEHNFTVITGPNMGGKSIYIKQIAILQIMAQVGCFVPATNAVFRLCDRIFSRIGFNDSVELNASTYVFEMKEVQHILKGLTPTSLVIIDELCRGTSVEEGASICWAVCEELAGSAAFTFFTTHFQHLTRLQDLYFNIVNRHATVTEEEVDTEQDSFSRRRLIYPHKIEIGSTTIQHYGLALASKTHLPEETVNLARELAELIAKNMQPQEIHTPQRSDEALLYKLNADIRLESRRHSNPDERIRNIIQQFKRNNPELIKQLMLENSKRMSEETVFREKNSTSSGPISNNDLSISNFNEVQIAEPQIPRTRNLTDPHTSSPHSLITNKFKTQFGTDKSPKVNSGQDTYDYDLTANFNEIIPSEQWTIKMFTKQIATETSSPNSDISNTHRAPNTNDNEKHTSVKSSTELLHTFTNIEHLSNDKVCRSKNQEFNSNEHENEQTNVNAETEFMETDIEQDTKMYSFNKENNYNYGPSETDEVNRNHDDANSSTDSSDLANELTQVIGYDESLLQSQINSNSQDMSIDEELMVETINDINDELAVAEMSIENLILTPPCEFQD